jgi:hypothetical protein
MSLRLSPWSHLHFFAFDFMVESCIYFLAMNNDCQKISEAASGDINIAVYVL